MVRSPKSKVWTRCRELGSSPRGTVLPVAAVEPSSAFTVQLSGASASVTTVPPLGPWGRYPTWLTRTGAPVSGTYTGGSAPPRSDTSSRQKDVARSPPPICNCTDAAGWSTEAVKVRVTRVSSVPTGSAVASTVVYGSAASWTRVCTVRGTVELAVYDSS